jgi:hypothetical protein
MSELVGADGKPVRSGRPMTPPPCPRCGADASKRVDGSGFGTVKTVLCGLCGYEFRGDA